MIYFVLFLLLFPPSVIADHTPQPILLNEFTIEPEQAVEIVNISQEEVDLSGWYIDDNGGKSFYTIPEGTTLVPASCLVIKGNFNLNTASSDSLRIYDHTAPPTDELAHIIDTYTYDISPGSGMSFMRTPDGSTTWQNAQTSLRAWNESGESCVVLPSSTPTPSPSPTLFLSPTVQPTYQADITHIIISEVMAAPVAGESEWIELYNNNSFEVRLHNWMIDDVAEGGSAPVIFSHSLEANGYSVIELQSAVFNNTGDEVRLLNHIGAEQDTLTYTDSKIGTSWGRKELTQHSSCMLQPTRGSANTSCILPATATPSPTPQTQPLARVHTPTPEPRIYREEASHEYATVKRYAMPIAQPIATVQPSSQPIENNKTPDSIPLSPSDHSTGMPLLATGYSLLSVISVLAKRVLSHVSLNI